MKSHHTLPGIIDLAQSAVNAALEAGARCVPKNGLLLALDATCGNGRDSLFLAETLHRLRPDSGAALLACDVQEKALAATLGLLEGHGLSALARPVHQGHENVAAHLPPDSFLYAAMYNLGFLPGGDGLVVTRTETTLASLRAVLAALCPGGVCVVHAYSGHAGGLEEARAVEDFFTALPFDAFRVARYAFSNKPRNPETLFLAEKR